jgi:serine/threonine protein kinase
MAERHLDEEAVFLAALQTTTREEQAAYVEFACAGRPELQWRVVELLKSHEESQGPFDAPPLAVARTIDMAAELASAPAPGTVIGPYKLLQQIGEGGMGAVYMAEQTQPVQRKVAVKVIKAGMDSRPVIARFEAERQALAMMDHVNIARVLDAGTTEAGRPYFVMELVHGVPITTYCDENHLTPRERLELFVPVCQAIQHAHQKGIIHRDIKPSNVMITLYDGKPVPKVIDFGVAKATEQKLTERTLFTQYGTMVGTLEYTSPEQAELSALGVDTRSDIYSLGVLLYELLTGSTPLSRKRVRESTYGEIVRMIKEEEPPKPSTRLSDSGETLVSISAQRQTEPAKLTRLVRGELDWIVMKCLEKDRNHRYATANGLTHDIEHYLNDEPVQACPPSALYRFRKLARRNKRAFIVASAAALVVVLALVGLSVSNILIRQEQARTREEQERTDKAQKLAQKAQILAQDRAEEVQRGLDGLKAANALLDRGRWHANERDWDDAHAAFTKAVRLRPDHVSVWVERGDLFARLGLWDLAAADFAREPLGRQSGSRV